VVRIRSAVVPAEAGTYNALCFLDSLLRGNDNPGVLRLAQKKKDVCNGFECCLLPEGST
jgi:hypothetical protein